MRVLFDVFEEGYCVFFFCGSLGISDSFEIGMLVCGCVNGSDWCVGIFWVVFYFGDEVWFG